MTSLARRCSPLGRVLMLGLLASLPANAAEIEVVAGGPDGLIQYNPSFVVRSP